MHAHGVYRSILHLSENLIGKKRIPQIITDPALRFRKKYITDNVVSINFIGAIFPMKPQEIQQKQESQWNLLWYNLYTTNVNINFSIRDQVIYNNEIYNVQTKKNWINYGFIKYELIKEPQ